MKSFSLLLVTMTAAVAVGADCGPTGCGPTVTSGCNSCGSLAPIPACQSCRSYSACGSCSSCSSCNTCQTPPACEACGGKTGGCCIPNAPIDIDSLTLEAKSKKLYDALQARLIFEVPEDAFVYLSGQRMMACGPKREYLVSVNDKKLIYKYEIMIDVVRGGQTYYKKLTIDILRAGAIIGVKVAAPPAPEGEDPVMVVAVAAVVPGGPPVDAEPEVDAPADPALDPPPADDTPLDAAALPSDLPAA